MEHEIQLINDGAGLAVIGNPKAVDLFLNSAGVESQELGLDKLRTAARGGASAGAGLAHAGAEISANAGRWVKLTEKSAQQFKRGTAMKGSTEGVSRAIMTDNGKITSILEFAKTPAEMATNPAMLAGAAGIMAQFAMQQAMDEITDYLATIDEKVEDVLRAQKDAALSEMIGAGFVIDDAMTVRQSLGRVPETTWDQVHTTTGTIASAQAYALRRLDAIAVKLESTPAISDTAKILTQAEPQIREWMAVLARSFQLLDAKDVLELERVLEIEPENIDRHRLALRAARQNRLEKIASSTAMLLERMDAAAHTANAKVLLNPGPARVVVRSSNEVTTGVVEFRGRLGIEGDRESVEARRWVEAAVEVRDSVTTGMKDTGTAGVDAARRLGGSTAHRARTARESLSRGLDERVKRRWRKNETPEDEA